MESFLMTIDKAERLQLAQTLLSYYSLDKTNINDIRADIAKFVLSNINQGQKRKGMYNE